MASTQLQLNNLVEFYLPIDSILMQIKCEIPLNKKSHINDTNVSIELSLPYTLLVQKLEFELDEQFCKDDFAKVFLFEKMFRKDQNNQYTQMMKVDKVNQDYQNNFQATASLDQELEILRNQVLSCDITNTEDSINSNRHSVKVLGIGNEFKVILRVAENFGVDLTSAKEHSNKELQEDLRSLSRLQGDNEEDENCESNEDHIHNFTNIHPQIGQLEIKNQQSQVIIQEISAVKSTNGTHNADTSRNQQKKKQKSFLEKALYENTSKSNLDDEMTKSRMQQEQIRVEKIFKRAFGQIVQGVRIYAYQCYRIPQANNIVQLINSSFYLGSKGQLEEKRDVDFLVALGMMSGRKFIQACEQLRRIQIELINSGRAQDIDRAIQMELLIADSMNQHSQMLEKIFAFQRAVDMSLKRKIKTISFSTNTTHQVYQIKEEEAYQKIMALHPYLIKILLQHIDSKIEAVKLAALRTIEFLVDTLGCSLDQYLIHILIAVIATYPRQNMNHQGASQIFREGFFQQNLNQAKTQNVLGHSNYQIDFANSGSIDSALMSVNINKLQIKEATNFQITYVQSIKNSLNHILESFISLLSSLSSNILHSIFYEVIQKSVFLGVNPFENQLSTDLRIYLLKFTDKIVNICQGDLILGQQFLNNIVSTIIPDSKGLALSTKPQKLGDSCAKQKQKASETVILACNNLWQTFRQKLFINYSNKGLKQLLEWIFSNLMSLAENSSTLITQDQQAQLTLVFDVIDLIASQQSQIQEINRKIAINEDEQQDKQYQSASSAGAGTHHAISNRDTRYSNQVEGGEASQSIHVGKGVTGGDSTIYNSHGEQVRSSGLEQTPTLIRIQTKSLYSLEIYQLINPILFWLDYSLEKQGRLPLFKVIWKTLNKILSSLPSKKIEIDSISIILPVLFKVNAFCKDSSPSLEMLQFLQTVFQDFSSHLNNSNSNKDLKNFLNQFIKTLCRCIPHHLHEEIFLVCEQILELHRKSLTNEHIQEVIDALINKYTMRSKAHKKLTAYFIQLILDESIFKLEKCQQMHQQQQQHIPFSVTQQDQQQLLVTPATASRLQHHQQVNSQHQQHWQTNVPGIQPPTGFTTAMGGGDDQHSHIEGGAHDEIGNYEYDDRESYQYVEEDDEEDMMIDNGTSTGGGRENHTNQDYLESPISQRLIHNQNHTRQSRGEEVITNSATETAAVTMPTYVATYFDTSINLTLFANHYEPHPTADRHLDHINLELYFEKIALLMQILKTINQKHIQLYQSLMNNKFLNEAVVKMFQNERSTANAIELVESLSNYYTANCAPKNIYEHPVSLIFQETTLVGPQSNNHQNSQNSGGHPPQQQSHQQQQLQFQQFNQNNRESSRSFMSNNNIQPLYNQQYRHGNQQQLRQSLPVHLHENMGLVHNGEGDQEENIQDEIDIINKERLILIELYATIIRLSINQNQQLSNAYLQFHTLNMLDNLFSNLMPVTTFQNNIVKCALKRRSQLHQTNSESEPKLHANEIPDIDKMTIIDNLQTFNNLMLQQQQPGQLTLNLILSEFECWDPKYLHARLQFAFKVWQFMENSLQQSSWSNVRSICYGLFCQILKIDLSQYKASFQNKLKQVLFPLLSNLLNSKESESKAGGLNILGAFCGIGHDFSSLQHFKISQNMTLFRKNSSFVSLAIWQQIFSLQDDWDSTIREAASVLIQFCAPRDSIKHFHSIEMEKYQLKLTQLVNTFNISGSQLNFKQPLYNGINLMGQIGSQHKQGNQLYGSNDAEEEVKHDSFTGNDPSPPKTSADHRMNLFNNIYQSTQSMRGIASVGISQTEFNSLSDEEKNNSDHNDIEELNNAAAAADYFYVDSYNEEQIKEMICIFKNDYKPPKSLWIEKSGGTGSVNKGQTEELFSNTVDVFDDNIVNKLNNKLQAQEQNQQNSIFGQYFSSKPIDEDKASKLKSDGQGESEYLIFERHFEQEKSKSKTENQSDKQDLLDVNQEELGIIDLDEADGSDEFDDLDDDKLPVLKNTYSKKNRPNNSKSVAIGSRSQDSKIKPRIVSEDLPESHLIQEQKAAPITNISPDTIQHQDLSSSSQINKNQSNSNNEQNQKHQQIKKTNQKLDQQHVTTHHIINSNQIPTIFDNRHMQSEEDLYILNEQHQDQQEEDADYEGMQQEEDGNDVVQDQMIDEYEMIISETIQNLNKQLQTTSTLNNTDVQVNLIGNQQQHQQRSNSIDDENPHSDANQPNKSSQQLYKPNLKAPASPLRTEKSVDSVSINMSQSSFTPIDKEIQASEISIPLSVPQYPSSMSSSATQAAIKNLQSKQSPSHITIAQTGGIMWSQQLNTGQPTNSFTKKTNDPQYINKSSYTAQANKLKTAAIMQVKKDQQARQNAFAHTSPGPLTSAMLHTQKKTTTSPGSKHSFSSYGKSNTRKRKSDYQRKSEVPSYNAKKFSSNSGSQNQSQQQQLSNLQHTYHDPNSKSMEKQGQSTSIQLYPKPKKQQTLMNQASQAFVSRAKSQSYLNSVIASGSNVSLAQSSRGKKGSFNQIAKSSNQPFGVHTYGKQVNLNTTDGPKANQQLIHIRANNFNAQLNKAGLNAIHKGYFSNDESQAISPTRSGDFNSLNKDSLCSDDDSNRNQPRSSSHTVKSRMRMMVLSDTDEARDQISEGSSSVQHNDHYYQKQISRNYNNEEQNKNEEYLEDRRKLEKLKQIYSSDQKMRKEQELQYCNIAYQQPYKQNTVVLDMRHYNQQIQDEEELESGEDSARGGNLKQLSSIDEEEDLNDRRQQLKVDNYTSGMDALQ